MILAATCFKDTLITDSSVGMFCMSPTSAAQQITAYGQLRLVTISTESNNSPTSISSILVRDTSTLSITVSDELVWM